MRLMIMALAVGALAACATSVRTPKAVSPAAGRAIHERLVTLDTHLDTPANFLRAGGWDVTNEHGPRDSQVDYPRMVAGGLDGGFWVLFTPQGPRTPEGYAAARAHALKTSANIDAMIAAHPDLFVPAYRADDAARIAASGKRIVYKSIENSYPLGLDPSALKEFYALGVRIVGLVHSANNDWADSATDRGGPQWHGLSPRGRALVEEANRLGVLVDASHASDEALDQMIALSKTPVILTHSGCKAIYDHPRNIDDERLRRLAASGGVIQMNSLYSGPTPAPSAERTEALAALAAEFGPPDKLSAERLGLYRAARVKLEQTHPGPTADFEDYMKQILHALDVAGVDHVGMGADWDGGGGVTGLEDVAALGKVTQRLLEAGYTEQDLRKIWSGNVLRLLRAAEKEAARQARAG